MSQISAPSLYQRTQLEELCKLSVVAINDSALVS